MVSELYFNDIAMEFIEDPFTPILTHSTYTLTSELTSDLFSYMLGKIRLGYYIIIKFKFTIHIFYYFKSCSDRYTY